MTTICQVTDELRPCYPAKLTLGRKRVQKNIMRTARLHDALRKLADAIRKVEGAVAAMKAHRDPVVSHIFAARRHYRAANDTKKREASRSRHARRSRTACYFGFRGSLDEW